MGVLYQASFDGSMLDPEFLGKRQIQDQPLFPLVDRKRCAWGRIEIVPLQHAVETISSLCSLQRGSHFSKALAGCFFQVEIIC